MNQSILDILPKKIESNDSAYNQAKSTGYNQAIDDVIESLTKSGVCIVPSEQEIENTFNDAYFMKSLTSKDVAKAIRNTLLGEDRKG